MTEQDVPGAVEAFDSGFLSMQARYGLPITGNSIQAERRRQNRTSHFLATDPGGSWVADDEGQIVGMSQSFVRDDYWVLSQLGTVPGRQGRGLGRELLRLASPMATRAAAGPSNAHAIPRRWRSTPASGSPCTPWWPPGDRYAPARSPARLR
jgi:GNAT superfamily N-acetyltransferase